MIVNEIKEIMNGNIKVFNMWIEGETIAFDTPYNSNWNFIPRDFEQIIDTLQQENARLKDNCKQLEKFICYEQDRLLKATSHIYQDSFNKIKLVNSDIFEELKKVENKMKELFKEN